VIAALERAGAPVTEVATQAALAYDSLMRAVNDELSQRVHGTDRLRVLITLDDYAVDLAREAPPEDVASLVVPLAVPLAKLMGQLSATAAIDEGCLNHGQALVRRGFLDQAHRGPEAALAAGSARIAVVERASRKLHREADPASVASVCAGMQAIVDAKAGRRRPMPAYAVTMGTSPPDPVRARVKAAWDAALAAGKPEIEAAQACLDAAEAAQAEVLAGQETERKRIEAATRRRSRAALARGKQSAPSPWRWL
jgi:hypothetical protein